MASGHSSGDRRSEAISAPSGARLLAAGHRHRARQFRIYKTAWRTCAHPEFDVVNGMLDPPIP